jgi:hypothetical protein
MGGFVAQSMYICVKTLENTEGAIQNAQSREPGNIGYTRHRTMLENTEGAFKYGQSRETGNIGYTRRRKTKHNMCWISLYASTHK